MVSKSIAMDIPRDIAYGLTGRQTSITPFNYGVPQLWLDGADTATFTTSGGTYSEWRDKSGFDRHASQPTSFRQPTSTTINGLNAVDFSDAVMQLPADLGVSGADDRTIIAIGYIATSTDFFYSFGNNSGVGTRQTYRNLSGVARIEVNSGGYTSSLDISTLASHAAILDGADISGFTLYRNLTSEAVSGSTVINLQQDNNTIGVLGAVDLVLCELIVYGGNFAEADYTALYNDYIQPKWGLT